MEESNIWDSDAQAVSTDSSTSAAPGQCGFIQGGLVWKIGLTPTNFHNKAEFQLVGIKSKNF